MGTGMGMGLGGYGVRRFYLTAQQEEGEGVFFTCTSRGEEVVYDEIMEADGIFRDCYAIKMKIVNPLRSVDNSFPNQTGGETIFNLSN